MKDVRLSLPTVAAIVAIASAGAFAAGRSMPSAPEPTSTAPASPPPAAAPPMGMGGMGGMGANDEALPPGHPPTNGAGAGAGAGTGAMPAGHPPVDSQGQGAAAAATDLAPAQESSLDWKAPPRWQSVPNTSSMRLATYRIPRAEGDAEDGDLSIMQAGGSVDANAERWIGQFDAPSQKSAKRTTRKVGGLDVTIVEVQGNYSGGMGKSPAAGSTTALLGAIVSTPGMPHFFKLTGPVKTVTAARVEFDAMIASLASRAGR